MSRTAVVLFNLGGPDSPEAVKPFLFNLFNDPLILRVPGPFRWLLARLISSRRAPIAREIYAKIGGRSPILEETEDQARALREALAQPEDLWVFVAMRYWRPFADDVVRQVKTFAPDRIVLCPLYPQFSTTTTESFTRVWNRAARRARLTAPTSAICCYPTERGFVSALASQTASALAKVPSGAPVRVLFSAHGLPKKVIAGGDPYQYQVERTVAAVVEKLARPDLDHIVCYQSRVGPLEWIRPYTDEEIARAGAEGKSLVVVPVAFVSEHSETLVELDIEYAHLASESGVPAYVRVPTVSTHPDFIAGLARMVQSATTGPTDIAAESGRRLCPPEFTACPCRSAPQ